MCSKIENIITFFTDAYKMEQRISVDTDPEKGTLLVVELKSLSPYVDNMIKYGVLYSDNIYNISSLNSIIGSHILYSVLNRFEKDSKMVNSYRSKMEQSNNLCIQETDLEKFMECFIKDVDQNFASYYSMCLICFVVKPVNTMIITPCNKCIPASFNKIYSNVVTDLYDKDINQFKLLLYTTLKAIDNKERFIPLPIYCLSNKYEKSQLSDTYVNRDFNYYLNHICASSNDRDLSNRLKEQEYQFLKHIIVSNNTRLNYFADSSQGVVDKSIDMWSPVSNCRNNIVFTISHPLEKQSRFDSSHDVVHMFHGSSICNWYSIMRNGLKNYSGSAMMSNGQVHGPGIYLATDIVFAKTYCNANTANKKDTHNIIGVVQVLNCAKYKKTEQIYVVPEESDILLKYLIVITGDTSDITSIQNYLTKELPRTVKSCFTGTMKITSKRLYKEYKELTKRIKKLIKANQDNESTSMDRLISVIIDRPHTSQNTDDCFVTRWNLTINYTKIDNRSVDRSVDRSVNKSVIVNVVFPRTFPSSTCIITCDDPSIASVPMMEPVLCQDSKTYTYTDPLMRYDKWRADVKVFKILEYMIMNIVESSS